MLRLEKFDPSKTYMFVDGTLATPDRIRKNNPAIDTFIHVLELNGDVVQAIMNLSALRGIHKIDDSITDDEAILAIESIFNTPAPVVISTEERIAAAMEFSNLMMLDDVATTESVGVVTPESVGVVTMESEGVVTMNKSANRLAIVTDDPYATLLKQNFERGLWSRKMVAKAKEKGVLTMMQHEVIVTGM